MPRISAFRQLGYAASARGFERLLEHFVATARVDPARVIAEARKRGLPVAGDDVGSQLDSLRRLPVARLDPLALGVVRGHTVAAGAQGFVTGVGGIATLPLAVSADTVGALYWVVRATSGVMNAYGFETVTEEGVARLRVGLMLALGVDAVGVEGTRVRLERVSRQLLSTPYSQQLLVAGGRQLVRRLSLSATGNRAAARVVPFVGGALSCAINAGLVRGVTRRAAAHYRAQLADWQRDMREVAARAPLAVPATGARRMPPRPLDAGTPPAGAQPRALSPGQPRPGQARPGQARPGQAPPELPPPPSSPA